MEPAVVLKGGMATLITLHFHNTDLNLIQSELQQKKAEASALFHNLPCAIDLHNFAPAQLDLASLLTICHSSGLLPIAVRNASPKWSTTLDALKLADLGRSRSDKAATLTSAPAAPEARIYQGNVRSGQQLYHDGNLTIFGTVSAGAEVLVSGSLHIFGTLRGRALAGIKGNEQAIICCQQFDAELISIAGQYRLFDDGNEFQQQTVAITLSDSRLNITRI